MEISILQLLHMSMYIQAFVQTDSIGICVIFTIQIPSASPNASKTHKQTHPASEKTPLFSFMLPLCS